MLAASANYSLWVTTPAAIVTAITLLVFVWRGLVAFAKTYRAASVVLETAPLIAEIKAEFHPNSGSSMHDRVERLQQEQHIQSRRLSRVERSQDKVEASLERIEDKLGR